MSEPIRFDACFAQGAAAIKPQSEGGTRLWVDAWLSDVQLAKLLYLWRNDVRFRLEVVPEAGE